MKQLVKCQWNRWISCLLAMILAAESVCLIFPQEVKAAENVSVMQFGGAGIANPNQAESASAAWSGDHIYFGNYVQSNIVETMGKDPIRWDVLSATEDGKLLLFSNRILDVVRFNETKAAGSNYDNSNLRKWLNSRAGWNGDYTSGGFYMTAFSGLERAVIMQTQKGTALDKSVVGNDTIGTFTIPITAYGCGISGDYVFLLSAGECRTKEYGFWEDAVNENQSVVSERTNYAISKSLKQNQWWTRSLCSKSTVAMTTQGGQMTQRNVHMDAEGGIRPACYVNANGIFATYDILFNKKNPLSAVQTANVSDWGVTLLDTSKSVSVRGSVTRKDNLVFVPYDYTGRNVSQISVMITDRPYTDTGAQILYYGALNTTLMVKGLGTFPLPEGISNDVRIYLMAEDVNTGMETDYTSEPLEISVVGFHPSKEESQGGADNTETTDGTNSTENSGNVAGTELSGTTENPADISNPNNPSETIDGQYVSSEQKISTEWIDAETITGDEQFIPAKAVSIGKKGNKITWNRTQKANGYLIYAADCKYDKAKSKMKCIAVCSGTKTSYTHKVPKKNRWYKYKVIAYRNVGNERMRVGKSFGLHCLNGKKDKWANPTKVKVSVSKLTLQKGKTKKLKVSVVLPKGKRLKKHTAKVRYYVTKPSVASVNKNGKIKAKKKGTTSVYVIAQNGVYRKIKVKVK